jgi:hypothetical protein
MRAAVSDGDGAIDPTGPDRDPLEKNIEKIRDDIEKNFRTIKVWVLCSAIVVMISVILLFPAARGGVWWSPVIGIAAVLLVLFFALDMLNLGRDNRILRGRLERLEFESEMMAYEASVAQLRAEKRFRINEQQLRRYYEQNLNQGAWVFWAGIGCVAFGIAAVALTFYAVARASGQTEAQIVMGAVGAVGAILSNYVAAIYLKMHAAAAESLRAFHARLVSTHELFLANLLASSVSEARRDEALCTLAFDIAKRGTSEAKSS